MCAVSFSQLGLAARPYPILLRVTILPGIFITLDFAIRMLLSPLLFDAISSRLRMSEKEPFLSTRRVIRSDSARFEIPLLKEFHASFGWNQKAFAEDIAEELRIN